MRALAALLLLLALAPARAAAAPVAITRRAQRDVMVTIHSDSLGLVRDVREARLPAGTVEVRFAEVAAQIDPTSVRLRSLAAGDGLRILEQNYECDLLSSQKLMEKYVGRRVRLYLADGSHHEPPCSRPRARSTRSTGRSTSGRRAGWSCRRCPTTTTAPGTGR